MTITVSTFYKFAPVADCAALKSELAAFCCARGIKGTILVAPEGINATVSGSAAAVAELLAHLRADPRFAGLESKESYTTAHPFKRMKVRVKREIVALGMLEANPNTAVGTYVDPEDWNALIADPDVIVVDTRNGYEFDIGTFARARDPKTRTFREFPAYVERELAGETEARIATFCTGGIRCEKATSYLKQRGFKNVYHLRGGILKYLETVPQEQSLWQGECFVFDERVALEHGVTEGTYRLCPHCGYPVRANSAADPAHCPQCASGVTPDGAPRA